MLPAEIIDRFYAAQVVSRNLTASLAFLTWDICITLEQEVQYIWMTPGPLWGIKMVYLFLRYFAFVCLIITQGVAAHFARIIPVPLRLCRSFFLFQIISDVLLVIPADIIFMIRVYALYNRQRWVAVVMASLLTLQIVLCGIMVPHILPKVHFNQICYITLPTAFNVFLSVVALIPPITAFFFILAKQLSGIREGWGTTPLMVLLTRDSLWSITGFVGVWILNPLIAVCIGKSLAHVGHLWFMSVVPSIGCRVILNMQRFKMPTELEHVDGVQLTTDIGGEWVSYQMTSLKSQDMNLSQQSGSRMDGHTYDSV